MRLIFLALSTLAVACGGPSVGDLTSQDLTLTVGAVTTAPDEVAFDEPQGGIAVSRAFVSTSSLSLLPCNEDAASLVFEPRGYELTSDPPFSERVTTAVNDFCGVRIDVDPLEENASEGVPEGASLFVEGLDENGASFSLSSESSFSLVLEADEGSSFEKRPLLLGFDVASWLAGLPLDEELAEMSAELFDAQLRGAIALYPDDDEDGALDDEESTPILRAAAP